MTLNTRVLITSPINPEKLWAEVLDMVAGDRAATALVTDGEDRYPPPGIIDARDRQTIIGQGLPAWTIMSYRSSGEPFPGYREDEDDYDTPNVYPAHFAELRFDTGYAYTDALGGCASLHARYLARLAELDYGFSWVNEYNHDLNHGFVGVEEFLDGGVASSEWYRSVIIPLMEKMSRGDR